MPQENFVNVCDDILKSHFQFYGNFKQVLLEHLSGTKVVLDKKHSLFINKENKIPPKAELLIW